MLPQHPDATNAKPQMIHQPIHQYLKPMKCKKSTLTPGLTHPFTQSNQKFNYGKDFTNKRN
jgi:hypothetical protein